MKRCLNLIFIIVCLALMTTATAPMAATTGQDLILAYSSSIQGETEPCG